MNENNYKSFSGSDSNGYNPYSDNRNENTYGSNGYYTGGSTGFNDFEEPFVDRTSFATTFASANAVSLSFIYMAIALIISAVTALGVYSSGVVYSEGFFAVAKVTLFVEFFIILGANKALNKRNEALAAILGISYAICTGFVCSVLFAVYDAGSIVFLFVVTAAMFAVIGIFAYTTKKDLTVLGVIGYMGLFAAIIVGIVMAFIGTDSALLSAIVLALFIGITAYDIQKIKSLANSGVAVKTVALFGALTLYLDFVNIFLKLLALFGKRK